jgi:UDPglucose 6-dehydrogenase
MSREDDLRYAPSLEIARVLDSLGARTVGYDPVAGKDAAEKLPSLKVVFDPYEALAGAHAAVLITEWEEIRSLDLNRTSALMDEPRVLVDGRNALDPNAALGAGRGVALRSPAPGRLWAGSRVSPLARG